MRNQINSLGVKIVGGEPLAVSTQFIESIVNASQFSVLDDAQSVAAALNGAEHIKDAVAPAGNEEYIVVGHMQW